MSAAIIGYMVMVAAGFLVAAALLAGAGLLAGAAGEWAWRRLKRVYHLNHLLHYLARLEKEGAHVFKKPGDDWFER